MCRLHPSESAPDLFSTEEPVPPPLCVRGCHSSPRSSLAVFRVHCYKFFVDDLRAYSRTQVCRSYSVRIKCHCHISKSLHGSVEPACACILEVFSGCNNVKYGWVLFLPPVQCQREPFVPDMLNVTTNNFLFFILNIFLLLFNYSCLHFLPSLPIIFQSQNIEFSVLYPLHICTLFFCRVGGDQKVSNLTAAPACKGQTTWPWQSPMFLFSPSWFLIPTDSQATLHSLLTVTIKVIHTLSSQFLLDSYSQSKPQPCLWSGIDSFNILFLTLSEGPGVGQCL